MSEKLSGEERAFVESFGVPIVSGAYAAFYFAALSEDSLLPDARELEQIRSFAEYVALESIYRRPLGERKLKEMRFPGDKGHNTVVFRKGHRGDAGYGWFYWRFNWETGPWPNVAVDFAPRTLVSVMDCCERAVGRPDKVAESWARWKEEHVVLQPLWLPKPRSRLSGLSARSAA